MTRASTLTTTSATPQGRAGRLGLTLTICVALAAILVLVGWAANIESLKRLAPGFVAMNPLTALCFVLAASGMYGLYSPQRGAGRHLAQGAAWCIVLVGACRAGAYFLEKDFHFDHILFASKLQTAADAVPNRMAPNTAVCFLLCGVSILLVGRGSTMYRWVRQCCTLLSALIAILAIVGYSYGVLAFSGVASFIPMAVHTAGCFLMLSAASLLATPREALCAILLSDNAGGLVARRLLPSIILLPIALGWLRLRGEQLGWFNTEMGTALMVVCNIALLLFLVLWTAAMLYRLDETRRSAEAQVRGAKEAAEAANRAKSEFLANMSHEIRTPMAAIIGYADRMLEPDQGPSDRFDCVSTIRRNGEHLLTLINDILDLSKIEAGEMVMEQVKFCPCQIISDVASIMRVRAAQKHLSLEVKIEGLIPQQINSDPTRLRQVLINLVGNAIKFTESGWVRMVVRLLDPPEHPSPRMRFDVIDSGIGMTPEQVSKLFRPFVQADNTTTRRFGGTGLGLSICKRLAEWLGGELSVDSEEGRGSRFSLIIPTGALEGVNLITTCTESIQSPASGSGSDAPVTRLAGRVLLADDGKENRDLLTYYLEQAGAKVTQAENGRIAVERALGALATGQPFDLIFMDMQMPDMDGYAASARLRSKGYTGPIVALTAHAMAADREKCLRSGCTDYLSKPARKPKLLEMAARYLAPAPDALSLPVLRSDVTDEGIRMFMGSFVAELPNSVAQLSSLLENPDRERLKELLHRLRGTAGLYGFMSITQMAGALEDALAHQQAIESVMTQFQELIEMVRRVEGYNRLAESEESSRRI